MCACACEHRHVASLMNVYIYIYIYTYALIFGCLSRSTAGFTRMDAFSESPLQKRLTASAQYFAPKGLGQYVCEVCQRYFLDKTLLQNVSNVYVCVCVCWGGGGGESMMCSSDSMQAV